METQGFDIYSGNEKENRAAHTPPAAIELPEGVHPERFAALASLLDDPDEEVNASVRREFERYGKPIARALRSLLDRTEEPRGRETITSLLHDFQQKALNDVLSMIRAASETGKDIELESVLVSLSQFGYPETDTATVRARLDAIALRAHTHFIKRHNPSELGLLLAINQAFFEEEGFCGASGSDYYHPDSSYVQSVLDNKRGIPISLSALYMLVAERAGVTLYGIGMPAHFVVYHPELDVFIDTFNKGAFLTKNDCKKFILGAGFVFDPTMLEKVTNLAILLRMIRNLIFSHTKQNRTWDVQMLEEVSHAIIEAMNQE